MVTIIISTINERVFNVVLPDRNDKIQYIVIHQNFTKQKTLPDFIISRSDVVYHSFWDKGLSSSRNFGLKQCDTEFAHFMDDDVEIKPKNILQIVDLMIKDNVDISTGMYQFQNGELPTNYRKNSFFHNYFSLGKVASIEICVRLSSINRFNLMFDKDFGLGSKFPSGEEYIFLTESLKLGLKVKFYPICVGIHPNVTSGMDFFSSDEKILAKSKMINKVFGNYSFIIKILFWLKKSKFLIREGYFFNFTKVFFLN